jgi:3-oxoadipate enol-lactonase
MSFADINGTRLFYESQGSGPALLFVHGATLDHRMWRRQVDAFAPRFRTVVYDLRGCGRSAMPDGEFKHYADAAALVDHLGLENVVVVGHSIGGLYSLELALGRPERLAGLVLLCMSGLGVPAFPAETLALFAAVREAARTDILAAKATWAAGAWFSSAREHPALAAELDAILADHSGWYWTHDNPATNLAPPAVERLAALQMPALVIDGVRDTDYNHAIADVLAARVAGARLVRIPTAGHMANMEAPELVNAAIADHASRCPAR